MKPLSTMNVIPFIDVMLVLLAIVLTTATFVAQGRIPVDLPSAAHADTPSPAAAVSVTIDRDGQIAVDGERHAPEVFAAFVDTLDRRARIVLRVDARVAFRHFVAVIDRLKGAGLGDISIVTQAADG